MKTLPIGSSSTLFKLESSLVSDIVAVSGPLPLLFKLLLLLCEFVWLWLWLLLLLFAHNGPRDVMSGDDDDESLFDFFESLLFEFERAIYCTNINRLTHTKFIIKNKRHEADEILLKRCVYSIETYLHVFHDGRFF